MNKARNEKAHDWIHLTLKNQGALRFAPPNALENMGAEDEFNRAVECYFDNKPVPETLKKEIWHRYKHYSQLGYMELHDHQFEFGTRQTIRA